MKSETSDNRRNILFGLLIGIGAIIFYLPFISRQFMGDDWLWLANARMALDNPILFLERPMYGYFRPLNLLWIFLLFNLFGLKAYLFSIVNILLHGCNVFLFWKVLSKFGMSRTEKTISVVFFAFYFLNVSAIGWISVGHDLWVVLFTFIFILKMFSFAERPTPSDFIILLSAGLAATLFKEAGFVTLGLYLIFLILKGRNPFSKMFLKYSILIVIVYLVYLIIYFKTRTVIDKDIVFGGGVLVNLWYLCSYLVTPFSARIVELFPAGLLWLLKSFKIAMTLIVPLLLVYIIVKKERTVIFFAFWSLMFLATVAVFNWGMGLFDIYPERTIARFMYVAVPGLGVIIGWLAGRLYDKIFRSGLKIYTVIVLVILFAGVNWVVVKKVSGLYFSRQNQCTQIISDLQPFVPDIKEKGSLIVLTDDLEKTPQIIYTGDHLRAILLCNFGLKADARICSPGDGYDDCIGNPENSVVLTWSTVKDRFNTPGPEK